MPLKKLPVVDLDNVNHRRRARETINQVLDHSFDDSRVQTTTEKLAGVTPVNPAFEPGDIRRYGALASSSDNSGPLAQAMLAIPSGGRMYVPSDGVYSYATGLSRTNAISVIGDGTHGVNGSRLKHTGTGYGMTFQNGGGSATGTRFEGFTLEGTSSADGGIFIDNGYSNIRFDNMVLEGFTNGSDGTCIKLRDTFDIKISGVCARQSRNGIRAIAGTVLGVVNTVWIRGCEFTDLTNVGISCESGIGWKIRDSDFSGLATNAIGVDLAASLAPGTNHALKSIAVIGCYFEKKAASTGNIGIRVGSGATVTTSEIQDVMMALNYFDLNGDNIKTDLVRSPVIWHNTHSSAAGFNVNISANTVVAVVAMSNRTNVSDSSTTTLYLTQDYWKTPELETASAILSGRTRRTGIVSPAAISANTNDYNPTGLSACNTLRVSSTGAFDLTGIVPPVSSQELLIVNIGTATITLRHESASSSAANRFNFSGAADIVLGRLGGILIWYDGSLQRWFAART